MYTRLEAGEKLIQSDKASAVVTGLTYKGELHLTNKRLLLEESPGHKWEMPLGSISAAYVKGEGFLGLSNKKLLLDTEFAGTAKIMVPNPKGWQSAIKRAKPAG